MHKESQGLTIGLALAVPYLKHLKVPQVRNLLMGILTTSNKLHTLPVHQKDSSRTVSKCIQGFSLMEVTE